jgi:antitoxin MazE
MRARVQRWGNSLALRIPKGVAEMTALQEGSDVDLSLDEGRLVVTPVRRRKYTLEELLSRVTDENIHGEIDTGPSVGMEAW